MSKITCSQCGKEVSRKTPVSDSDDNSLFVCEECWQKNNARQIEKEKKINAKLAELFAKGLSYNVAQVTAEVEAEMSK